MAVTKPISMYNMAELINMSTSGISLKALNTNKNINGCSFYRPGSWDWTSFLKLTKFETYTLGRSRYPTQPLLDIKSDTAPYYLGEWYNYNHNVPYPALLLDSSKVPSIIKYQLEYTCTVLINDYEKVTNMLGVSSVSDWGIAALGVMFPAGAVDPHFTYLGPTTPGTGGPMTVKVQSPYFVGGCPSLYVNGFILLVFTTGNNINSVAFRPTLNLTLKLVPFGLINSKIEPSFSSVNPPSICKYKIILHLHSSSPRIAYINPRVYMQLNQVGINKTFLLLSQVSYNDKFTRILYEGSVAVKASFSLHCESFLDLNGSSSPHSYEPTITSVSGSNIINKNIHNGDVLFLYTLTTSTETHIYVTYN